jgi:HSP20 family molecular chaperone IbpA
MSKKDERTETGLEKREAQLPEGVERLNEGREFIPPADIYETEKEIVVVADLPGVAPDGVDITLERNTLEIYGTIAEREPAGAPAYSEYEVGNFIRRFSVSNEVDRDGISAQMKDGVLTLTLPKMSPDRRRIAVKVD